MQQKQNQKKRNKEIEFKWEAQSLDDYTVFLEHLQDLGAAISKPMELQIQDQYVDSPDQFFQNAHLECRIRLSNGRSELTLKSIAEPDQGRFSRYEKTFELPHLNSKKATLTYVREKYFRKVQLLFALLNNRQINALILPCGTCGEACFDQVLLFSKKRKFRMHEIELEFKSGDEEAFKAFVGKLSLSLTPSKLSKYQAGLKHLFGEAPSKGKDTLDELTDHILKMNIDKLKESAKQIQASSNPEAIHDMRVASRRLRAAIQTFRKLLTAKTRKIRQQLKKLGCALGKKRDLDVFLAFVQPAVKRSSISWPEMDQAQRKVLSVLRSKGHANLVAALEKLKPVTTGHNIFQIASKRIRKALSLVLDIAGSINPNSNDKSLHALRISVKKLRYTCEFFEPAFSKSICSLGTLIEKTKEIQDILGEHQDAITGFAMLSQFRGQFSSEEFQQIKIKFEQKKEKNRKLFFRVWNEFLTEMDAVLEENMWLSSSR